MTTDPQTDRPRALHFLEAADFLRDAHFRDGLSVQEIGTALRHMADEADPMVGSLARDGFGLDEIAAMPAAPPAAVSPPPATDRAGLRDRVADVLAEADGWRWAPGFKADSPTYVGYQKRADAVLAVLPACFDPIECSHEAALGEAQQEARRLGLMVDEYGQGASALTDKLTRARDMHRETCPFAQGQVPPTAFRCGMCEVLDAPAVLPPAADRSAVERVRAVLETEAVVGRSALEYRGLIASALMADEERQTETQAPVAETQAVEIECANCWRVVENRSVPNMGGPARDNWVHIPGGFTPCFPQRGADSPRAEPELTVMPQPETVHGCPPDGSGLTPCCQRTPFELPLTDRISSEVPVTCKGA